MLKKIIYTYKYVIRIYGQLNNHNKKKIKLDYAKQIVIIIIIFAYNIIFVN